MSLTFDKLARLSSGLQVDISALFNGEAGANGGLGATGRRSITRAGEGKAIETRNYSHLYPAWELLNKRVIPIVAELHARSLEEFGELIRHPGEEYAFVLEGEVDLYTSLYAPVRLKPVTPSISTAAWVMPTSQPARARAACSPCAPLLRHS